MTGGQHGCKNPSLNLDAVESYLMLAIDVADNNDDNHWGFLQGMLSQASPEVRKQMEQGS